MSSVGSASGKNRSGQQQPVLRVLPADERLDGVDAAVREPRLGLVVQHQLVGVDRTAKLGEEREVGRVVVVLGWVVSEPAPRCCSLARYSATSARRRSSSTSSPSAGEHVADARLDRHGNVADDELLTDHRADASEQRVDPASDRRSGSRTRRRRGARSCRGPPARRRSGTRARCSTVSPLWWPSESLISLKRSRSTIAIGKRRRPFFHPAQCIGDPALEQSTVRQLGQRIVLGEEGVELYLAAQPATHRDRDREQHDVERSETDREIPQQLAQPPSMSCWIGAYGK